MNYCNWVKEEDDILIENYSHMPKKNLLSILPNRTWSGIRARAKRLRIFNRVRNCRKYDFDFHYFDEINTEDKAYWLGFVYADGSVSVKPDSLRISLVVDGKKHLEKFKEAVRYTGLVLGPYNASSKSKGKTKYTLNLQNEIFVKSLINHGATPRKTFTIKFPSIAQKLRRHFIRGFFDGDGCIHIVNKKCQGIAYKLPSFSICGAVPGFLENIVKIMVEEAGVNSNSVRQAKNKEGKPLNVWRFDYNGMPAIRIRDWMYKESTIWMDCKKEKFYICRPPMIKTHDKQYQEEAIDQLAIKKGYTRLSAYKGFYESMDFECNNGHKYTTSVYLFKSGSSCPRCHMIALGKLVTEKGKSNLLKTFAQKKWKLVSEYSNSGKISIMCEHEKIFSMCGKSAMRDSARCDCLRRH